MEVYEDLSKYNSGPILAPPPQKKAPIDTSTLKFGIIAILLLAGMIIAAILASVMIVSFLTQEPVKTTSQSAQPAATPTDHSEYAYYNWSNGCNTTSWYVGAGGGGGGGVGANYYINETYDVVVGGGGAGYYVR